MNRKKKLEELERIGVEEFRKSEKTPLVIILDNIRSHHNVGSVFRTADGFLIEEIILCGYTPIPPHREIHKTALGATDSVCWSYEKTTQEAVLKCRKAGMKVYAVEQAEKTISLQNFRLSRNDRIAVVLGNEVSGVEQEVVNMCEGVIELPMRGTKHSLNISVCAGIVMWDLFIKWNEICNTKAETIKSI